MIKVLVTGGSGQLGSSIRSVSGDFPGLAIEYTDIPDLDITNPETLLEYFQHHKPDYIINCAAYTAVDKAEAESEKCYLVNATAVRNLSEATWSTGCRIIHISTDYVFNGTGKSPYKESDPTDPGSVYGKSKLLGESYLENNQNAITVRTSWLYSQFGNNFARTIIRVGKEKGMLRVVSDQHGSPTYAPDLAAAVLEIIRETFEREFPSGIYHYCNSGVTTWYEFAKNIIAEAGINCIVNPISTVEYPTPAKRPSYSVLNTGKIRKAFNLEIPFWKESLKKCISRLPDL